MNYEELIEKALKGRTVNAVSKVWGVPQPTLSRYAKGERMPDWNTGLKIARDAGIDPTEAFEVFAEEERTHKIKNFKLQMGHVQTTLLTLIAAVGMAVTLFLTPAKADASTYKAQLPDSNKTNLYYVKSKPKLKVFIWHPASCCSFLVCRIGALYGHRRHSRIRLWHMTLSGVQVSGLLEFAD